MAKLKCRCGHKFSDTLADLQLQGIARLKCPACGQVSTIPIPTTKPSLMESTVSESQRNDADSGGNDFFETLDSRSEVDESASSIDAEVASSAVEIVRPNADVLSPETSTATPPPIPERKNTSPQENDGITAKVGQPGRLEYVGFFLWIVVAIIVIAASSPRTNPDLPRIPGVSSGNRFLSDNAVGATANALEHLVWLWDHHPQTTNALVTNLLLLGIAFLLWKLNRTISRR